MAANTGRTVEKYTYVIVGDSANTLREVPVRPGGFGDVGLAYESKDVTAAQDAIKNSLDGQPSASIKLKCPWDTSAAVAAPTTTQDHALSGSATVFLPMCGDNLPHTLQFRFGERHPWETGEQAFGLQRLSTSNSGYRVIKAVKNGDDLDVELEVMGSVAPSWSTAALTAGS